MGLGLAGLGLEVAAVAIGLAHALGVFVQLAGVEGAGEEVLEDDGVGNADGLEVLHRVAQDAVAEVVVAVEGDLADLDRRAFLDVEGDADGGRRDGLDFGLDGGELVAVLGEQVLQDISARLMRVGSYWLSTVRPTLAFLKRSSTSERVTAFRPL
jgi:hypothetical protein